jgi:hypothetical protein
VSAAVYPAGVAPAVFKPGTLLACHGTGLADRAIQLGEWLWLRGADRRYAWVNHIACITDPDGALIEMQAAGAVTGHASDYQPQDYWIIDFDLDPAETARAVTVWEQILAEHDRYGWVTIAALAVRLTTRLPLQFATGTRLVCSGAAVVGLCATTALLPLAWRVAPGFVTPAEVARQGHTASSL